MPSNRRFIGDKKVNSAFIEQEIKRLQRLKSSGKYKDFWKSCKEVAMAFKYSDLSREDRKRLWKCYDGLCKEVKTEKESYDKGTEDAKVGNIDLRKYATDSEYKTAFDREEIRKYPNLRDVEDPHYRKEFLKWYHQLKDDRKAEHELDKTYRRAEEERKTLNEIRNKRERQVRRLLGKSSLLDKMKDFFLG